MSAKTIVLGLAFMSTSVVSLVHAGDFKVLGATRHVVVPVALAASVPLTKTAALVVTDATVATNGVTLGRVLDRSTYAVKTGEQTNRLVATRVAKVGETANTLGTMQRLDQLVNLTPPVGDQKPVGSHAVQGRLPVAASRLVVT